MTETKRFVSCIYLYNEHAVKGLDDMSVVETDPIRLAKEFAENNADELLIFDLSYDDESHETALLIIKEICSEVEIPVIGAGNIKRMEDVKKLLYAGCKRAALDYDKDTNIEITKEVSEKFGKDKILACISDAKVLEHYKTLIEDFVGEIILMNPHIIKDVADSTNVPMMVSIREIALNKLIEVFGYSHIYGVTGNAINDNAKEILSLKELLKEQGISVGILESAFSWADFKKDSQGLVPVVVQDYKTDAVLMLAYMDEDAFNYTLKTGKMTYYSRSRKERWVKGETSGHYQYVKKLTADCDMDTILAKVYQVGVACHTGAYSCFFNEVTKKNDYDENEKNPLNILLNVSAVIADRKKNPKEGSYTNYLFDKGIDKILKKVGEEATEIVIAAKNPNPEEIKYEISDFLYHVMVLMEEKGVTWQEIMEELAKR